MDSEISDKSNTGVERIGSVCVTKAPPWGWLIVADLMISDLWAGLFVVSALSDLVAHDSYGPVARIGYLLAFPLLLVDLFFLVADLGDPLRFHHMLRVFKIRSPMSVGMWVIAFSSVTVFGCFILAAVAPATAMPRLILGGIGIAPALFVGGYKGVMFSTTAQPNWKNLRWLGAELASSSGLLGVAGLLLVALLLPVPGVVEGMRGSQIALLLVNLTFGAPLLAQMLDLPIGATALARTGGYGLIALIGWVAPLVLAFIGGTAMLVSSSCLVLIGALARRNELVRLLQRPAI